jgi:hypothetical protein
VQKLPRVQAKMMIGQFFILSPRGDTIINKDFRGDAVPGMQELFFRKVMDYPNIHAATSHLTQVCLG